MCEGVWVMSLMVIGTEDGKGVRRFTRINVQQQPATSYRDIIVTTFERAANGNHAFYIEATRGGQLVELFRMTADKVAIANSKAAQAQTITALSTMVVTIADRVKKAAEVGKIPETLYTPTQARRMEQYI